MGLLNFLFRQTAPVRSDGYRVFTNRYDRVVFAKDLNSALGVPGLASAAALDQTWKEYQDGLSGWKVKATLQMMELARVLYDGVPADRRSDTLVTVLVDQSGSMRGQKMLMTVMATDILQAALAGIGISCEVLGFTTVRWRGGKSRSVWKLMGRPPNPGRLCDLLHVVYKSADDERASTDGWDFHEMLRPDLPKENVDGEAIEWAVLRMRAWPKKNKVLLVISDGAPVDDSTIQANSAGYLPQHLRAVIADLIAVGDVKICALGLAHDVQEYYPIFERVEMPDDLPRAICSLFQRVIFSDSDDPQTAVV